MIRSLFLAVLLLATPAAATPCDPQAPADSAQLWARTQGRGPVTVVFEAGFGGDASAWAGVEPRVRAAGWRTLVYDRAGMGKSPFDAARPYSLDNDVADLRSVLARCAAEGPILLVGHSYGGAIALVAATREPKVAGVVLLDAVTPGVWTPAEVEKSLAARRPQYETWRRATPALARVAIPWFEAKPATAAQLEALAVPEDLPIVDVVAQNGVADPDSAQVWRAGHAAFVAGHPARRAVLASGSGHDVMADRPDLVVETILGLLSRLAPPR